MFKLALDNQVSKKVKEELSWHYDIVIWADTLPDEYWVKEALNRGANVFISPDLDIINMLTELDSDADWYRYS